MKKGNKVISFFQNEEYDAKWETGTVNIDVLMDTKSKCAHFGLFHRHSREKFSKWTHILSPEPRRRC